MLKGMRAWPGGVLPACGRGTVRGRALAAALRWSQCWLLRMALALWCLAGPVHALQITDDRGVVLHFDAPPRRIVTLLPSLTETVCALGQCDRLVGTDRYSNFPASVPALPKVGGGLDPQVEAVVALRPDVVLIASSSRAGDRLTALGLKVVALEPKNHADVRRVLGVVGTLLGVADAQRVWREIDAAVAAAAQSLPPSVKGTRVYYEVGSGPYAAGASSFIGETMARLGVENIVPPGMGPFPKLNPEYVVRARPDLIMVSERGYLGMPERPGWAALAALRAQRVCRFPAEEADVLVRPGPRMAEAARIMARCLQDKAGGRTP
jgi:iron complex transport system substrate-binding protein